MQLENTRPKTRFEFSFLVEHALSYFEHLEKIKVTTPAAIFEAFSDFMARQEVSAGMLISKASNGKAEEVRFSLGFAPETMFLEVDEDLVSWCSGKDLVYLHTHGPEVEVFEREITLYPMGRMRALFPSEEDYLFFDFLRDRVAFPSLECYLLADIGCSKYYPVTGETSDVVFAPRESAAQLGFFIQALRSFYWRLYGA